MDVRHPPHLPSLRRALEYRGAQPEGVPTGGPRPARSLGLLLWSGAALVAGVSAVVGQFGWSLALPSYLLFVTAGTVIAGIDVAARRVPDVVLLPASIVGGVLLGLTSSLHGNSEALARAALGAAALLSFYFMLLVISPHGIGLGDVKLAGFIGMYLAWLSWRTLAFGTLSAFVLAAVATAPLLAIRRIDRSTRIPFAPFMVAGAIAAIVVAA